MPSAHVQALEALSSATKMPAPMADRSTGFPPGLKLHVLTNPPAMYTFPLELTATLVPSSSSALAVPPMPSTQSKAPVELSFKAKISSVLLPPRLVRSWVPPGLKLTVP